MGIIKLPNVGDEHTMKVATCERSTGTYGEQVKFSDGTDTLFLPQGSADMQLKRIFGDNFAYTDAVGNSLRFSRTPNNKRPGAAPYWNIDPATAAAPASKRMAPPERTTAESATRQSYYADSNGIRADGVDVDAFTRRKRIAEAYCALYSFVQQAVHGTITPEAVQAATATIWISWDNFGIQPDGTTEHGHKPTRNAYAEKGPEVKMPEESGKRLAPPSSASAVRGSPASEPDYSNFPPADRFDDDLPF